MTVQDIRAFKVDLLDTVHELATEPVPNTEEIRHKIEALFSELEKQLGKKETGTTAR